jgi:hypothetical protein
VSLSSSVGLDVILSLSVGPGFDASVDVTRLTCLPP